jgi:hypothetical protein
VAVLAAQVGTLGWNDARAAELERMASGGPGLAGAEALLALGDAEFAGGRRAQARTHWSAARGRGVDVFIEPRLARADAAEAAERAQAAQERAEQEGRQATAAADQRVASLVALSSVGARLRQEFDQAYSDAEEGNQEPLRNRENVMRSMVGQLPGEVGARFNAVLSSLDAAGDASRALAFNDAARVQVQSAAYSPSYASQRLADLAHQRAEQVKRREAALAMARAEFEMAMRAFNSLPVQLENAQPVRLMRLGAP